MVNYLTQNESSGNTEHSNQVIYENTKINLIPASESTQLPHSLFFCLLSNLRFHKISPSVSSLMQHIWQTFLFLHIEHTVFQPIRSALENKRIIIIIIIVSCHRPFLPGTSLQPAAIPTAQAPSSTLQYLPYYVCFFQVQLSFVVNLSNVFLVWFPNLSLSFSLPFQWLKLLLV